MKTRRRRNATNCCAPDLEDPVVKLWLLRILVTLGGHKKFVNRMMVENDDLCRAVGMGLWVDKPDGSAAPDPDMEISDDLNESSSFPYRQFMTDLRKAHRGAERQLDKTPLPGYLQANIERLSALVGLNELEGRVLGFAIVIHNERLLDEAADYLGHDLSSIKVCHALAVILGVPVDEIRAALQAQGVLTRAGLMALDRHGYGTLRSKLNLLSETFADQMLLSEADPINLLRGTVDLACGGHLDLGDYEHIQADLNLMRPLLSHALKRGRRGVNIFIHGAPGTGKTQLARTIATDLKCDLFEIASEDDDGDPIHGERRLRAYRAAQTFLAKRKALIVFDEVEDIFSDGSGLSMFRSARTTAGQRKAWINRALEESPVPTIWLSNSGQLDPAFIRRFDMVFELTIPPRSQRMRIIEQACADILDVRSVRHLAEVEQLAPAVVTRAASVVRAVSAEHVEAGERLTHAQTSRSLEHLIDNTLRLQGHQGLTIRDANRISDVYDPAFINADADLNAIVDGIRECGSARLCLYGPPGTGKTAYGRWLAEQIERPIVVMRVSDLRSKYVGETERNIARAFRQAAREGTVLMIDEVDSFLQDRRNASASWQVTEVNEMLTQMEDFCGVFIASTNLIEGIDQASLRRFDVKARFDWLRNDQVQELLIRVCLRLGLPPPTDDEKDEIGRLRRLTPGDFAAVMRQHRFRPIDSAARWIQLLRAEIDLKESAKGSIGFLH